MPGFIPELHQFLVMKSRAQYFPLCAYFLIYNYLSSIMISRFRAKMKEKQTNEGKAQLNINCKKSLNLT